MEGNQKAGWCGILAKLYSDFGLDTSQPNTVMKAVERSNVSVKGQLPLRL